MLISSFEVVGLPGQERELRVQLNPDLNIVTGRNGSGKTTLLKLLWYVISGNIEHALREVPFSRVKVETTEFLIDVIRTGNLTCKVEVERQGAKYLFEDEKDENGDGPDAEDLANNFTQGLGSSLFFPTFRRIEGGFSLAPSRSVTASRLIRSRSEVDEALTNLAKRLSVERNTFVTSISTADIVSLLLTRYTDISEAGNDLQRTVSQEIITRIKQFQYLTAPKLEADTQEAADQANSLLNEILVKISEMDEARQVALAPFDAMQSLVATLFIRSGIKFSQKLSFGDSATAVSSDSLSAGEKQLLSFICYNTFYTESVIFIDEPELSLHVDWQRQLFPILLGQGTRNQFIVATHSPFIYTKFQDREILLHTSRGMTRTTE